MVKEETQTGGLRGSQAIGKRMLFCFLILISGAVVMVVLSGMKKPPAAVAVSERFLKVAAVEVDFADKKVSISGYGEAQPLTVLAVSPEVSGRAVYTHPKLHSGEVIAAKTVLFKIDPSIYAATHQEAQAAVEGLDNRILMLKTQYRIDSQRQKTIERNKDLAKKEYERVRSLFLTGKVVAQSEVDKAEQNFNHALDQADQMTQNLALYPLRIREAESELAAAEARLSAARENLARCTVRAPFKARVQRADIQSGQYLMPGQPVLTLADDSLLELHVSLDAREARRWLPFSGGGQKPPVAGWFPPLKAVGCSVRWTESLQAQSWSGTLHRVVAFQKETRTVTVAVRVDAASAVGGQSGGLPLVHGMFCLVEIPGNTLEQVARLPLKAVSFENTVYRVSPENRLETVPVEVAWKAADVAYISTGLAPGDRVITTRLIDPLENALLDVHLASEAE